MLRGENGITLVALIITIIILVILAAVSIATIYNMGIVNYAVNGSQNYAKAGKAENEMMDNMAHRLKDLESNLTSIWNSQQNNL